MSTPVTNFGKVTVSTGYDSAAVSIVLSTGHGSRLPSTFPYPLTWWNATDYPDPADDPNKEIVLVTGRTSDTLTVSRAQEGTSATTKNTGGKTYKMLLSITKKMWDDLALIAGGQSFRGVHLRNHPDSDKMASQVLLVHADLITMDDGSNIPSWDLLPVDLTASGAGGIDTGSEQASTWYELYGIYNPTTQTKKLIAHRAKDYFLDEDITAGEDSSISIRGSLAVKIAQGFKVDTAGPIEFIDAKVLKVGTPTGNIWFTIEATNGGVPSNTPLATSDKFDVARFSTTATMVRIPFRTPLSASAATQYHLVLQGDFTINASNYFAWRADASASAYANGQLSSWDGGTWTNTSTTDLTCKVYVTRNDSAVVLPSGYTQKGRVGWAYNDSGSNLLSFRQYNNHWQYASIASGLVVNETAAVPTLIDLRTALPPITAVVELAITGTGAAAGTAALMDLKGVDVTNGTGGPMTIYTSYFSTGEVPGCPVSLALEYNAVFVDATSAADLYLIGFTW